MRIHGLRTASLCAAATLFAIAGCSAGPAKKNELKLYNDKGAWTQILQRDGRAVQAADRLSMKPVGYTDEAAYQAFIKASFRTNVKPDLFTWQTGGSWKNRRPEAGGRHLGHLAGGDQGRRPQPGRSRSTTRWAASSTACRLTSPTGGCSTTRRSSTKYGLKPPTTWDDLIKAADTLKQHGQKAFYQHAEAVHLRLVPAAAGRLRPRPVRPALDRPGQVHRPRRGRGDERWKSMMDAGYFSDPGDKTDPADVLKSGKAAMVSFGTWFNTSMTQRDMKPGTDYGFFAIPNVNPRCPRPR